MASEYITPGDWAAALRTMRLGTRRGVRAATLRDIALTLASLAEYRDGTRIFPGTAKLAVFAEVDYRTARTALTVLRDDLGLIVKVRPGRSRGDADEYRLAMPDDITDRVEVLNPAQIDLAVERIRVHHRRSPRSSTGTGGTRTESSEPVDNSGVRVRDVPVPVPAEPTRTGTGGTPNQPSTGTGGTAVRVPLCPPTEPLTETHPYRDNSDGDLRTAVTHTRATGPDQDPIPPPMPERCAHGLASRRRADGTPSCAICRREAAAPDNVVHLRPRTA